MTISAWQVSLSFFIGGLILFLACCLVVIGLWELRQWWRKRRES